MTGYFMEGIYISFTRGYIPFNPFITQRFDALDLSTPNAMGAGRGGSPKEAKPLGFP